LVNVSVEQQIKDNYLEFWFLINVTNRQPFEGANFTWSFWIETDIKIDDEIILEANLAKVVDSGIIDAAGFTREYWILESYLYLDILFLWGFDKETGILIYMKSLHPEGANFMLTSTNIFTVADKPEPSFLDNIPGFPYESIIIGLIAVIIIIWRARKL